MTVPHDSATPERAYVISTCWRRNRVVRVYAEDAHQAYRAAERGEGAEVDSYDGPIGVLDVKEDA